jgi:tetratricopeptide (TPR) repeat protein
MSIAQLEVYVNEMASDAYSSSLESIFIGQVSERRVAYYVGIVDKAKALIEKVTKWERKLDVELVRIKPKSKNCSVDTYGRILLGLELLRDLDKQCAVLTNFLTYNCALQLSAPIGPLPQLDRIVQFEEIVNSALSLFSPNLVPGAVTGDGFQKSDAQCAMEALQYFRSGSPDESGYPINAYNRMPKPPWDLNMFLVHIHKTSEVLDGYASGEHGRFRKALHHHLLVDSMLFLLSHELAHLKLGHTTHESTAEQSRQEEVDTDIQAIKWLELVPQFDIRALLVLFAFASRRDSPEPEKSTHPFSLDRFLHLCVAALQHNKQRLKDVNIGLALLARKIGSIEVAFKWPDGRIENVPVHAYSYYDFEYACYLDLYIEHPKRTDDPRRWFSDADVLWENMALLCTVSIRDRIQSTEEFVQSQIVVFPALGGSDVLSHSGESFLSRCKMKITAPPEVWINNPNLAVTVVAIEPLYLDVEQRSALSTVGNRIKIEEEWTGEDFGRYFHHSVENPLPLGFADILLVARKLHELDRPEAAVVCYEWVHERERGLFEYPDLLNYARDLQQTSKPEKAVRVSEQALNEERSDRPGFHLVIAQCALGEGDFERAFEHCFLELFGVGEYGPCYEEATRTFGELMKQNKGPFLQAMNAFFEASMAGQQFEEARRIRRSIKQYRKAQSAIETAVSTSQQERVSLRQCGLETAAAIARCSDADTTYIEAGFQELSKEAPGFAPALINLAQIAIDRGDRLSALLYWKEAKRVGPFNHFVVNFFDVLFPPNPEIDITKTRMSNGSE